MKITGSMLLLLLLSVAAAAQNVAAPSPATAAASQAGAAGHDDLTRMRDDLNRLESLNLNMSSEIEFLRDQNLQILLRTNSQMWTVLIRDLRRQIDLEEQRRVAHPDVGQRSPAKRPDGR
jgi:hypothetical protein